MINLMIRTGLYMWSYLFNPNSALVVSLSKRQFMALLLVFTVITLYLVSTDNYHII